MPWQEPSRMSLRQEFVTLAAQHTIPMQELCQRFGISRKTGYKWLTRSRDPADGDLRDRSRRPHTMPTKTGADLDAAVVAVRRQYPTWGGRKIHYRLLHQGVPDVPAPSTITDILHRHALITPTPDAPRRWQRFEHAAPNDLWQMDFLGHVGVEDGQRVHPLTILDDHSRFLLALHACVHEQQPTVQTHVTVCFERYGMPRAILMDNGPPWGTSGQGGLTAFEAWLLRLGVEPWHGRPAHPQTQGKIERLHGTIAADVFAQRSLPSVAACQPHFDEFRQIYNHLRPHEGIDDEVPISRYEPSLRSFPKELPEIVYRPDDQVRKVRDQGAIGFANRSWFVSRGLIGLPVAVRPTTTDGVFQVVSCHREVAIIDLTTRSAV